MGPLHLPSPLIISIIQVSRNQAFYHVFACSGGRCCASRVTGVVPSSITSNHINNTGIQIPGLLHSFRLQRRSVLGLTSNHVNNTGIQIPGLLFSFRLQWRSLLGLQSHRGCTIFPSPLIISIIQIPRYLASVRHRGLSYFVGGPFQTN